MNAKRDRKERKKEDMGGEDRREWKASGKKAHRSGSLGQTKVRHRREKIKRTGKNNIKSMVG